MEHPDYQVICETLVCEEGPYTAYGMVTRTGTIHDISADRQIVEEMAVLFDHVRLDPGRAETVIEQLLP
ncbi:MAG: hypothetical protein IKW92_00530 [Firmicutes bacterium]|nr:hypothetical protein [Bacillota bacterium]